MYTGRSAAGRLGGADQAHQKHPKLRTVYNEPHVVEGMNRWAVKPGEKLHRVQKKLAAWLGTKGQHPLSYAYQKGKTREDMVAHHVQATDGEVCGFELDIRRAFPSVTRLMMRLALEPHVLRAFREDLASMDVSEDEARHIARAMCDIALMRGQMNVVSPTSAPMFNVVTHPLINAVATMLKDLSLTSTWYCDKLVCVPVRTVSCPTRA